MNSETAVNMAVHREWAKRPDDERFLSLDELQDYVVRRTVFSNVATVDNKALRVYGYDEANGDALVISTELGPKLFTHWSFGQIASLAGAPAGYLRKISAPLAAANINYGIEHRPKDEVMIMTGENDVMRSFNGATYGRIWDHQITEATRKVADPSIWTVPSSSYTTTNPRRATTLYASDRDIFIFLVDEKNLIDLDGRALKRGFIVCNSETGAQTFWVAAFLYDTVCDNRIIWGMTHKVELRIRHCSGAPERFLREGQKALSDYSNSSATPIVEQIKRAQAIKVGNDEDEVLSFLKKRNFTAQTAGKIIETSKAEGYDFYTAWGLTGGITAQARSIQHTDKRVQMEREAGKLMDAVLR